jgi:GxxExxY protein
MEQDRKLPYFELTGSILNCCFEVMKELGPGFLERVYKNALVIAMRQKGLQVEVEQSLEIVQIVALVVRQKDLAPILALANY